MTLAKQLQSQKIKFLILVPLFGHYNAKITKMESKIPSISGLATNAALTTIKSDLEKKISNTSSLVKKADCNTKSTEIEK